ncbi:MAG: biotin/lipoyl-containing protein [Dehalococcoidia bacterium]|nr:biotin/lipoyl-containing protein [Dehalococcoidia bacterium]
MKTLRISVDGNPYVVELGDLSSSPLSVVVNGRTYSVELEKEPNVSRATNTSEAALPAPRARTNGDGGPAPAAVPVRGVIGSKTVTSPMPGKILAIHCSVGCQVSYGDKLLVLEAMKMENLIRAEAAGVVKAIQVTSGQSVKYGEVLVIIE